MESRTAKIFLLTLLLFLSYIIFFHKLGSLTIEIWDEARNSINALEMSENGNYLVTTYQEKTDTWNTKPPLLIIFQAIFIKLFGVSELSVRLPSAIAATITVLFVFFFTSKYTKSHFIGFFSSFILLTTPGLVDIHGVRSGDYEAMLMLFTTLYSLFYLSYIETKKIKYLYFFSIAFTLAFMTKSAAALLFLPALFIYTLYRKRVVHILKSKHFYFSLAIPVIIIGCYYLYRTMLHPGYLKIIYENEFGGRYLNSIEGHVGEFSYYWKLFVNTKLKYWLFLALSGLFFIFFEKNYRIKRLYIYASLLSITHLLVISVSATKIHWYGLPEFPFWSIMAAISLYQIICFTARLLKNETAKKAITGIIIVVVLLFPMSDTIKRIQRCDNEYASINTKMFLRDDITKHIDKTDKVTVLTTAPPQNLLFYIYDLQLKGYNIQLGKFNMVSQYDIVVLDEYQSSPIIAPVNILFDTQIITKYHQSIVLSKIVKERTPEEALDYAKQQLLDRENSNEIKSETENDISFDDQIQEEADAMIKNATAILYSEY